MLGNSPDNTLLNNGGILKSDDLCEVHKSKVK
jgi:hypothetical protein